MLNQIILVGRIVSNLEVKENEEGKKYTSLTIAIPRSFKNNNGEYETDFIECMLYNDLAKNTTEYCKKGDIVGVKGRLQNTNVVDIEMQKIYDSVRKQVKDSKNVEKQEEKIRLLTDISSLIAKRKTIVVAEKVTFLSSKASNESEEE